MREKTFLIRSFILAAATAAGEASTYCDTNDLPDLPANAKEWRCFNPWANDDSQIPIGDKCALICKDGYKLYHSEFQFIIMIHVSGSHD